MKEIRVDSPLISLNRRNSQKPVVRRLKSGKNANAKVTSSKTKNRTTAKDSKKYSKRVNLFELKSLNIVSEACCISMISKYLLVCVD